MQRHRSRFAKRWAGENSGAEAAGSCLGRLMNRESEAQLVGFCVEQHGRFDAEAWGQFSAVSPVELAAAARYLAGVDWFGHRAALAEVAAGLSPHPFAELARAADFDASRFAGLLKAHLRYAGHLADA